MRDLAGWGPVLDRLRIAHRNGGGSWIPTGRNYWSSQLSWSKRPFEFSSAARSTRVWLRGHMNQPELGARQLSQLHEKERRSVRNRLIFSFACVVIIDACTAGDALSDIRTHHIGFPMLWGISVVCILVLLPIRWRRKISPYRSITTEPTVPAAAPSHDPIRWPSR